MNEPAPKSAAGSGSGNPTLRWVLWAGLALVVFGLLVAFARQSWLNAVKSRSQVSLDRFNTLPAWELTERSGRKLGSRELRGKIWLANFIFTTCPGPCPRMTERFYELQQALKRSPDVKLVSYTVNPSYDTPEVLTKYAQTFNAVEDKWYFFTGTRDAIYSLAHKGFLLGITDAESGREIIKEGDFVHSTKFALVDRNGQVRGYYDSNAAESVQKALVDVGNLLREQPN
ncbi:MAG: SCO family protein [Verrucomicrobia bacterium]|nr:SCO family protein [Verrucomicrobiota bacterium]